LNTWIFGSISSLWKSRENLLCSVDERAYLRTFNVASEMSSAEGIVLLKISSISFGFE